MRLAFPPAAQRQSFFPSLLREFADSLFAVVFPSPCSLCGKELDKADSLGVCRACWASLSPWPGPACTRCGLPLVSERALDSQPALCGLCRQEVFDFDLARSFGPYCGALRAAVLQLKFRRRERLGRRLGELLVAVWKLIEEACPDGGAVIVPVPLHAAREQERGFNQAAVLAEGLIRGLEKSGGRGAVRLDTHCLCRTRATAPQTGLSLHARHENVRGVFAVTQPERVQGRVVVLVDDVMTTGATLSACARALKGAGGDRVLALTLARATPEFPDAVGSAAGRDVDDLMAPQS